MRIDKVVTAVPHKKQAVSITECFNNGWLKLFRYPAKVRTRVKEREPKGRRLSRFRDYRNSLREGAAGWTILKPGRHTTEDREGIFKGFGL